MIKSRGSGPLLITAVLTGVMLFSACTSSSDHPNKSDTAASDVGVPSSSDTSTTPSTASPSSGGSERPTGSSSSGTGSSTSGVVTSAPFPTPSKAHATATDQQAVLDALPGSKVAGCVAVGTHTDLRSGTIAAGNFAVARKQYTSTVHKTEVPEVFLYVIPEDTKSMSSVKVTVDPMGSGVTRTVTSKSVQQADQWRYFAVNVPVHAPGSYRLTMQSGTNTGCFEVTFTA
jgi:hypothetical protein